MPINKIISSFDEAVADIHDGDTVMIGGFGNVVTMPSLLIEPWPVRVSRISRLYPTPPPAGPAWGKAKRSKPKTKKISDAIQSGWWEKYKPPPLPEK